MHLVIMIVEEEFLVLRNILICIVIRRENMARFNGQIDF